MDFALDTLPQGKCGLVSELRTEGAMRRRLMDLGFTPGTRIEALYRGGRGGMTAYLVRDTVIALRPEDAQTVRVRPCENAPGARKHIEVIHK